MSATSTTSKRPPRGASLAMFVTALGKVIAAIKANFALTKTVTLANVAVTWGAIINVLQAAIDTVSATVTAKKGYASAVAAQHVAVGAAKAQLKLFTAWAVAQHGDAAYEMFGLAAPKPHATRSAVAKAVSHAKAKATRAAKKKALAAVTGPSEEESAGAAILGALAPSPVAAPATTAVPAKP